MALAQVSLDDRYTLERGRVLMTGIQALVRLPMLQRQRDLAAGLNTAGFISGYRGSPLGGLDQALWRARKFLDKSGIVFQPGINEDLAATAVWGSQQVGLFPGARHDGVFALWYGKGPGVDRSLDVLKHGNHAGTAKHGGVLVVAGDDHAAKSSTLPHQSDHVFAAAVIPVLNPSGVQDYLDLGIHGWAMSRYSGCWVAFKAVTDTVESTAVVDVDPHRVEVVTPGDFVMPPGGLSIRWPDPPLLQEARMQEQKAYAALAYARANRLNRIVIDSPRPRLGIITAGKSYLDVRQALDDLGIDEKLAAEIGLRVMKVGMTWPLEPEGTRQFAQGLEEILVVEEKRQHLEYQLKEELYNWSEAVRPRVIGKFDEKGEWSLPQGGWLLPAASELTPAMIARAIAGRIARFHTSEKIAAAPALHRRQGGGTGPPAAGDRRGCRTTARAARTTPARGCPRAAGPWPASAATTWRPGSTRPPPRPSARWAARVSPGSARRRSPTRRTSSPISATAPTSTPASWRSGPRPRPASTSPTRSSTTTRSP